MTSGGSGFASRSDTLISGGRMTADAADGGVAIEMLLFDDGLRSLNCRMTSSWLLLRVGRAGVGRSMVADGGGMGFDTDTFRCTTGDYKI